MIIAGRYYHWSEARILVKRLDSILESMGRTAKANGDPLTKKGFDQWVNQFSGEVLAASKSADDRALKAMIKGFDKDWAKLPLARREKLIASTIKKLALKRTEETAIIKTIGKEMKLLISATKQGASSQLANVDTVFDAIDGRIIKHVETSSAHFIRDAYGKRRAALSKKARRIVADGVEKGFDSATIGETLSSAMSTGGVLRAQSYWNVVSSIYAARSRSFALGRSYESAGIEFAIIDAIRDERTTEQCNFLHGKRIPVGKVMARFDEVAAAPDPSRVVDLQPFLQVGKNDDGDQIIYFKDREGNREEVAVVEESASGQRDTDGKYNQKMSDSDMVNSGIGFPPYHGMCRTTTIADID